MVVVSSDNYVIVAAVPGDGLALPAGGTCVNVTADQAAIDAPITGASTLLVNGAGVLLLGGANSGSWGTDLESGTVQLALGTTLGAGSLIVNGGELDAGGNNITVAALAGAPSGSGGVITNNDSGTTSTLTVTQNINSAFSGEIEDGNGIVCVVMAGPGALVLPGSNAFSGGVAVTAGVLMLPDAAAVPDGTSLTVGADALAVFGPPAVASPDYGGQSPSVSGSVDLSTSLGADFRVTGRDFSARGRFAPGGNSDPVRRANARGRQFCRVQGHVQRAGHRRLRKQLRRQRSRWVRFLGQRLRCPVYGRRQWNIAR